MLRTLLITGAIVAFVAGVALAVSAVRSQPRTNEPITGTEARALLGRAVRLAQDGHYTELCESVAATRGTCRFLLQSADDMHMTPGAITPRVVGSSYVDDTLVLHLEGVTAENKPYDADFAVIRQEDGLRSPTAVYWSGVSFAT